MDSSKEVKIAFVIGNGYSRTVFNVSKLADFGVTYGCNILIEDTPLDNTVVVDRNVLIHLISQGYAQKTNLWTRGRWIRILDAPLLKELPIPLDEKTHRWDAELHWGSGTHAVHLAASQDANVVVLIGFDLWPRTDAPGNIYHGTQFYKNTQPGPECWIHQIYKVMIKFPDVSFVQIQPAKWKSPVSWDTCSNYSRDSYSGLRAWIKNM